VERLFDSSSSLLFNLRTDKNVQHDLYSFLRQSVYCSNWTRLSLKRFVSNRLTTFQMAEAAVSKEVFGEILARISRL